MLVGDRDRGVADERRPAGEQLVEQAAGGVDVAAGVDLLAAGLLGREVLRGADHGGGLGHRGAGVGHRAGDAEVHHLHVAGAGEHDVGRLDVAVHDALLVAVGQRGEHAVGDLHRALGHQPVAGGEQLAQRRALDVLHHDVGHRVAVELVLAGVVDGDDRRVVQRGGGLGLAAEPGLERRVAGQVRAQHLDGDGASQPGVMAEVDLGHAPASEQLADLVSTAQLRRHCGAHSSPFLLS